MLLLNAAMTADVEALQISNSRPGITVPVVVVRSRALESRCQTCNSPSTSAKSWRLVSSALVLVVSTSLLSFSSTASGFMVAPDDLQPRPTANSVKTLVAKGGLFHRRIFPALTVCKADVATATAQAGIGVSDEDPKVYERHARWQVEEFVRTAFIDAQAVDILQKLHPMMAREVIFGLIKDREYVKAPSTWISGADWALRFNARARKHEKEDRLLQQQVKQKELEKRLQKQAEREEREKEDALRNKPKFFDFISASPVGGVSNDDPGNEGVEQSRQSLVLHLFMKSPVPFKPQVLQVGAWLLDLGRGVHLASQVYSKMAVRAWKQFFAKA